MPLPKNDGCQSRGQQSGSNTGSKPLACALLRIDERCNERHAPVRCVDAGRRSKAHSDVISVLKRMFAF